MSDLNQCDWLARNVCNWVSTWTSGNRDNQEWETRYIAKETRNEDCFQLEFWKKTHTCSIYLKYTSLTKLKLYSDNLRLFKWFPLHWELHRKGASETRLAAHKHSSKNIKSYIKLILRLWQRSQMLIYNVPKSPDISEEEESDHGK